jgi:hypothetical protein
MNKTPTSVMVLGIIGIILGALGVCGIGFSVLVMSVPMGPPNPALTALYDDPIYRMSMWIMIPIGMALLAWLVIASIGSLKLKPWARKSMVVYAWVALIQTVIGGIFNMGYVVPKMMAAMPAASAGPAHAGAIGGAIGGSCGSFLGLIYPTCILYFFTRTHVVNAFNGIFPASPTDFPVIYPNDPPPPPIA